MRTQRKQFEVERIGDTVIISFTNRKLLDEENIIRIGEQIFKLINEEGWRKILFDWGNVEYVSSTALGKFITLEKTMQGNGGKMVICQVDPQIFEVFKITRLNKFFTFTKTKDDGLVELQPKEVVE